MTYVSREMQRYRQKINKLCPVCKCYFCACQIVLKEWLEDEKKESEVKHDNIKKREKWETA